MTEDKIIIIRLIGGLGNQLFQMQYGILLKEKIGGTILLDDSFLAASSKAHEKIAINDLEYSFDIIRLGWVDLKIKRVIEKIFHKLRLRVPNFFRPVFLFENSKIDLEYKHKIIIDGFWQNVSFLNDPFITSVQKSLNYNSSYENPQTSNLVCVHVRRGDYLTDKKFGSMEQVLVPLDYYLQAFEFFNKEISHPFFEIYSDDESWAIEKFSNINNIRVVKSKELLSHELLSKMSTYQNYIIANSTLSWWAAVLSKSTHKKVIFPKRWSKNNNYKKIKLPGWVAL